MISPPEAFEHLSLLPDQFQLVYMGLSDSNSPKPLQRKCPK